VGFSSSNPIDRTILEVLLKENNLSGALKQLAYDMIVLSRGLPNEIGSKVFGHGSQTPQPRQVCTDENPTQDESPINGGGSSQVGRVESSAPDCAAIISKIGNWGG
jgi:hypothetical protein